MPSEERVMRERLARAMYARRPAMTSSQLHRYALSFDDARAYGRIEVSNAYDDADAALAAFSDEGSGIGELREAVERFIADYDDGDRADAGVHPLMEAHVRDFRSALVSPDIDRCGLAQEAK